MMEMVAASAVDKSARAQKESVLRDFVRFSWGATRGLSAGDENQGRELVHRMVEIGRVTPEQGERMLATLLFRMQHSRSLFESRVEASIRKAVDRLAEISSKELLRLNHELTGLENRLVVMERSRATH